MTSSMRLFIVLLFICCLERAFSFPAPLIQLPTATSNFNISNALTKALYSVSDNRGMVYKQADPFQQPNLLSVKNKHAISFAPKNVFQSKSLTGPFTFPSSKLQIVALISLFTRNEKETTVPFTLFTASNDALTLQYEYDTKCFGFYWKNRGVKACADDQVNAINVGDFSATLIFASIDKNFISLRVGGASAEYYLEEDFKGINGSLVLGSSPFIDSPFYGVIHNLEFYVRFLSDAEKLAMQLSYMHEYPITAGTWQFWRYDTTYTNDFATLSRYGDQHVSQASSSPQFKINDISALTSTVDKPATLCVAHNSPDRVEWQPDTSLGLNQVLNRHWKVVYVPGSGGNGLVNITVNDLPTVDTAMYQLVLCYKVQPSDQCSLYSARPSATNTFTLVPYSGYYYLALTRTCEEDSQCSNFVKPVSSSACQFQCYQHNCYCMPEESTIEVPQGAAEPITEHAPQAVNAPIVQEEVKEPQTVNAPVSQESQTDVPVTEDEVVIDDTKSSGRWIYPITLVISFVVIVVAVGLRYWFKSRRTVVEHLES